jgi:hypothetical protein
MASGEKGVAISVDHNTHLVCNASEPKQSTRAVRNLARTCSETFPRDVQ